MFGFFILNYAVEHAKELGINISDINESTSSPYLSFFIDLTKGSIASPAENISSAMLLSSWPINWLIWILGIPKFSIRVALD